MGLNWLWEEIGQALANATPVFQFLHGLAFFVLGMATLIAIPRAGRLEIGRRLPLLAIFASCQAIVAWNAMLSHALSIDHIVPPLVQTLLLGLGYSVLLSFGLLVSASSNHLVRPRDLVPTVLLALWLVALVLAVIGGVPSARVAFWGEVVVRYALALPGGLIALWGLQHQTHRAIDPRMLVMARKSLRIAGAALGIFGLLAGLVLPTTSLLFGARAGGQTGEVSFPAISPLLTLCGVALTYGLTRTLNVVQREVERWVEGVEQSQALTADRERIGRELHDGIIQSIYAAGLMLEAVRQLIPEDPGAAQAQLSRAMTSLNLTIQDIRRYIFDLREAVPQTDLVSGLRQILRDFHVNTLLETELIIEGKDSRPLGAERQRHIFLIVREGLSNVARHSQARKVQLRLFYRPAALQLDIADDGVGLTGSTTRGQGLRNIQERARLLEGALEINSTPDQGVTLTVTVPYFQGEMT
jgi:signal transduction histidine kinase